MITQRGRPTNTCRTAWAVAAGAFILMLAGCGDEGDPVDPDGRLCDGETGVGLLIEGRADPLEFCVDDPDVSVVLTSQNRYDVQAQVSNGAGVFVVRMVFAVRSFPATLRITEDLAEAVADIDAVWLYYQEIPAGGDPIESFVVDAGTFTLSFVDEDVATGVIRGVVFDMRDFTTGDPAGQREFSEGIFSISTKEPTAAPRVAATAR
ncbi:MAG TPA: hypothetical protein VEC56_00360 [Candidatus Krumholzibacteria bacterium]|nr:hypothetical protein [Candidatus Krumholzibacteria bacterium]